MRRDPIRNPGLTQLLWPRERSDDSKFPFLFFALAIRRSKRRLIGLWRAKSNQEH